VFISVDSVIAHLPLDAFRAARTQEMGVVSKELNIEVHRR
jgi:hypothetical protein